MHTPSPAVCMRRPPLHACAVTRCMHAPRQVRPEVMDRMIHIPLETVAIIFAIMYARAKHLSDARRPS